MILQSTATRKLIGLLILVYSTASQAQLLKYNNEEELFGAAAVSPGSGRQLIHRLVALCSAYGPSVKATGEQQLEAWDVRHRIYLDENAVAREQYLAKYYSPKMDPKVQQAVRKMFEVDLPKMMDAQFEAYAGPIKAMPTDAAKASMCDDYIRAIGDGKFDLMKNDPSLTAYFDKRLRSRAAVRDLLAPHK